MKLLRTIFAIKSLQLPLQRVSLLQEMGKKGANFLFKFSLSSLSWIICGQTLISVNLSVAKDCVRSHLCVCTIALWQQFVFRKSEIVKMLVWLRYCGNIEMLPTTWVTKLFDAHRELVTNAFSLVSLRAIQTSIFLTKHTLLAEAMLSLGNYPSAVTYSSLHLFFSFCLFQKSALPLRKWCPSG